MSTGSASVTHWQIAAGSESRDYSRDFLKYGLAFVGIHKKQSTLMAQVDLGDFMILRQGLSHIAAVGQVVDRDGKHRGEGDKQWLKDYDGWNLPAYCYVDWHVPPAPVPVSGGGLTRGTIRRINTASLIAQAQKIYRDSPDQPIVASEPPPPQPVSDSTILSFLISEGLRPAAAEDLTTAFRRIRLLAQYYYDQDDWKDVREHETRTFLIMPLLLALGWAEQQIKIELGTGDGGRIDVACFSRPYRRDANGKPNHDQCVLILESKGFTHGLYYAPEQAYRYAKSFPSCRALVVSNGYCYKAYYRKDEDEFASSPSAYLNLLNPTEKYPLDPNVDGCLELLRLLLPHTY